MLGQVICPMDRMTDAFHLIVEKEDVKALGRSCDFLLRSGNE